MVLFPEESNQMAKECILDVDIAIEKLSLDESGKEEKSIDVGKASGDEAHLSHTLLTVIPL